ncbi:MAG TPA: radical SAM protein [Clostridia bacterium]|nr:radical SAM protein [Clostridia bacterium]
MLTDFLRRIILGKKEGFSFTAYKKGLVDFEKIEDDIGLYIHIPFCQTICPYCPYNKTIYNQEKAGEYKEALLKELILYKNLLGNKKISSVYIGGGTPTLLIKELGEVIGFLNTDYGFHGDIGIELYPSQVNEDLVSQLKELGIELVSLGVQTFNNEKLKFLGRNYEEKDLDRALTLLTQANFKCVDVDLMTNLPGQSWEELEYDLRKVYSYPIDQLSVYPLIVFPMTGLGRVIEKRGLSRFSELEERKILKLIDDISAQYGYKSSSVWTYGKSDGIRYTSVTRESFLGIGAGASSLFDCYFYLNTFDVDEYIKVLNRGRLPINLVNRMNEREKMIFWLFWRFYEGVIDEERFRFLFNREARKEFRLLFGALRFLGMSKSQEGKIILTDWGRFAYHFIEKQYSLHYLNKLWQAAREEAWIREIVL